MVRSRSSFAARHRTGRGGLRLRRTSRDGPSVGAPLRIAEGASPEVSPDGRYVLYVKETQIYRGRVTPNAAADSMDRGQKPFIKAWGRQSNPRWSPDGSK